ncbi:hypothetical protein B0J12DRAFT_667240 [Macrophomina phaseolina]|uniref:Uncharacterized protein n=1 Tax=Macrophomina phaseolina TaxID=35725 RepID=A0ABQ8G7Z4_9PEZI|nr:hypothetical protein B0J12DRAFT_667240 [Macrophomina phaseolina]
MRSAAGRLVGRSVVVAVRAVRRAYGQQLFWGGGGGWESAGAATRKCAQFEAEYIQRRRKGAGQVRRVRCAAEG